MGTSGVGVFGFQSEDNDKCDMFNSLELLIGHQLHRLVCSYTALATGNANWPVFILGKCQQLQGVSKKSVILDFCDVVHTVKIDCKSNQREI